MENITTQFISYFSLSEFIDTVLTTFLGTTFVAFVDTLSPTFEISWHTIT